MTSLNLSINGPSIRSSYDSVIKAPNSTSSSPTDVRWALFSVQAPLANAFQDSGNKESVLKVDGTGSGELDELIEDFSEGRIQFAFVRVKDPNSGLPKNVLIAWCGGGVPERTKGYFTSHLAAVSKVLHGYHVQITARSQDDLEIDSIMKKVSDASGAKYSAGSSGDAGPRAAPPPLAKKPVFGPTSSSSAAHAPLVAARNRRQENVDADGWGDDAPPVTRTQIEKVESAYKPVKVNMAELTKQSQPQPPRAGGGGAAASHSNDNPDVIGGGYKPVGKVDIAAIRAAAKESLDDRPTIVKGAYEPVGKVDIAAIRAKAQRPTDDDSSARPSPPPPSAPADDEPEPPKSLAARTAMLTPSESDRLTSLPKPKIANRFGGAPAFSGTKAPIPGSGSLGLGAPRPPKPPPVGSASRTFADQGGKTPAQIWAEKKAQGGSGAANLAPSGVTSPPQVVSPLGAQKSGGEWKSGYKGKSWGAVQTTNFGRGGAVTEQRTGGSVDAKSQDEPPSSPGGGVSALRDRFKGAQPMGQPAPSAPAIPTHTGDNSSRGFDNNNDDDDDSAPPPPIPSASRPPGAFQLPGLPSRPPPPTDEDEEEEESHEREQSPVRLAVPVARAQEPEPEPEPEPEQEEEPAPPVPVAPRPVPPPVHDEPEPEPEPAYEPEPEPAAAHAGGSGGSGQRALVQYDYEKAEDNEIELVEGQYVTNIEQVDEDWWMGTNEHGETGLFPSNYVELVDDDAAPAHHDPTPATATHVPPPPPAEEPGHEETGGKNLPWAYAQYDYEAGEDNELSFPEGAKVTDIEFPDDDWWFGHYQGQSGLFPSNYVELQQH
ncbi:hypothetical protein HMPREF1624_06115 [Sporothrix schenckii ATCC 58251]|uniref:SH3 domain-containing protein n=1 Tax=Sporothrix schenckii (strain ATCC 58251 / de Perez 2211183) TaxID=1391915 RepID=U7PQN9_SPOS1|nr:hypothetical protein HMPREF1624_06115 [Sporothrix schenckii ATCC 58251]